MRTILVNLEISPVLDSALHCALLMAQRFGSYIEGLHMRPGQPDIIAAGADGFVAAAPDLVAGFEREARERAERARETFEAFMARARAAAGDRPAGRQRDQRRLARRGHERACRDRQPRAGVRSSGARPAAQGFGRAQHGGAGDGAVRSRAGRC